MTNTGNELVLGVLSDNHGEYYPEIEAHLITCDAIIHCGDAVKVSILNCLNGLGPPLYVAYGNNDGATIRKTWKKLQIINFDKIGLRMLAFHNPGGYSEDAIFERPSTFLKDAIDEFNPHLVIFGHWHSRFARFNNNRFYFNPGAITIRYTRDDKPGFAILRIKRISSAKDEKFEFSYQFFDIL